MQLPILKKFRVETPMTNALRAQIVHWVSCGYTGGYIRGKGRLGKSEAIQSIGDNITDYDHNVIPTRYVQIGYRDKRTILGAFHTIASARSIDLAFKPRVTADRLCDDLTEYLLDLSMVNAARCVVLLLDEGQFFSVEQYRVLAEIQNRLDEYDVTIHVFFIVNTDEFAGHVEKLLTEKYEYIRERFFNYEYTFHGIRSEEELAVCLAGYDKPLADFGNLSITHIFSPKCKAHGFKLESISSLLWSLWVEYYAQPLGYKSWGMTFFNRTITYMMHNYLSKEWSPDPDDIEDICLNSLEAGGNEPTISVP
jgi:hypothetical protein